MDGKGSDEDGNLCSLFEASESWMHWHWQTGQIPESLVRPIRGQKEQPMQRVGCSAHVQCHAPCWQLAWTVCKVRGAELAGCVLPSGFLLAET